MKNNNLSQKADNLEGQSASEKEISKNIDSVESLKTSQSPARLTDSISNGMESDLDENMYPLW